MKAPTTLAGRLRAAREERNLGVNELNRLVRLPDGTALSDGYISSVETGRRKRIQAVYANAIAAELKVRAEWLTDGRGPRSFSSGEMPAMVTAAKRDKPNLERVIDALGKRKRWGEDSIAAARAIDTDLPADAWPGVLDRIESALRPIMRELDR